MIKKSISILVFISLSLISYSTSYEEAEIIKLKDEIKRLESRITRLEEAKKKKEDEGTRPKIGLVLSGGGAKGFAHVGVLKEIEKRNIPIDYITGTSMGSVVGAMYSIGYSPSEIEKIIVGTDWSELLRDLPNRDDIPLEERVSAERYSASVAYDNELNIYFPKGVRQGQRMYLKLKEILGSGEHTTDFSKLPIPLKIVATDLGTGKAVAFDSGDLAKVVNASIAIPTLLEPVNIKDRYYVDGLVARNLPVEDIAKMGADIIIAVDVGIEVSPRDEYNILTVLDQIMAIQSSSSTPQQKKIADIIIEPEVEEFNAADFNKEVEIIKRGSEASYELLDRLSTSLDELDTNVKRNSNKKLEIEGEQIYVEDIFLKGNTYLKEEIVSGKLNKKLPAYLTLDEIDDLIIDLYALSYIDKAYYEIRDDALYVEVIERPGNYLRLGYYFDSEYGTKILLNTDLQHVGFSGSRTTFGVGVGNYKSLDANHFIYYGLKNKVGLILNLSYDEKPLFIYDGKNKQSEFTTSTLQFSSSVATYIFDSLFLAYGFTQNVNEFKQDLGRPSQEVYEYSENYGSLFFELSLDTLDRADYPTKGIKSEFKYLWGGSIGTQDVNFYGPSYILEGYYPISNKLAFMSSVSGGSITGDGILADEYFKIGGVRNRTKSKEFSFYGYNSQRKLVDEFLIGQLGLQYRMFSNFYLQARWNTGTFTGAPIQPTNTNNMWENVEHGYGLTLGLDSPLGPLELTIMKDIDDNGVVSQFNIGYVF